MWRKARSAAPTGTRISRTLFSSACAAHTPACPARPPRRYLALSREVKRIDGVTRSPVLSALAVTLAGLPCVRAFGASALFERDFHALMDANNLPHITFIQAGARAVPQGARAIPDCGSFATGTSHSERNSHRGSLRHCWALPAAPWWAPHIATLPG